MQTIKVGVVGAGIYGNYHIHTFLCNPLVEKIVFCDLDKARRAAVEERYGVHCYDLIRYITGAEAASVFAQGSKQLLLDRGIDTWDSITALIQMTDGSTWTVESGWVLPNTFPKSNDGQLVILTDRCYLKNESYRGVKTYTDVKESLPNYIFMNFEEDSVSGFGLEPMQEFVANIVAGRPFRTSATDGLRATQIAAAVHESLETGGVVAL